MDTAPFQQLESDKTEHLLAEDLDSLQLHSAVRDCPALRTAAKVATQLGTWCLGSYYLCSLAPMHFFVLAF